MSRNNHASGDCYHHSMSDDLRKLHKAIMKSTNLWELRDNLSVVMKAAVYLDRKPGRQA